MENQNLQNKINTWKAHIDAGDNAEAEAARVQANTPAARTLSTLEDVQSVLEQLVITLENGQTADEKDAKMMGALLADMRGHMAKMAGKPDPETPDQATPVVAALAKLQKTLTSVLARPITVDAPEVHVSPPGVDLGGVEKAISKLSQSFKDAIATLPETPEADFSPMLTTLREMSDQLASIDVGTRLKPVAPTRLQVTNPDGTVVGSTLSLLAKRVDTTTTPGTIYVGAAPVASDEAGSVWQMKKIATANGADVTWADGNTAYDNAWSDRASLSYL